MAELADAHGSGPCSARNVGSTPTDGTIFFANQGVNHSKISEIFCGYGITAVHQPSKLDIRVRLPLPAPLIPLTKDCRKIYIMAGFPSGQRGQTVNLLAMLSVVRIHLQPPFSTFNDSIFCCRFFVISLCTKKPGVFALLDINKPKKNNQTCYANSPYIFDRY